MKLQRKLKGNFLILSRPSASSLSSCLWIISHMWVGGPTEKKLELFRLDILEYWKYSIFILISCNFLDNNSNWCIYIFYFKTAIPHHHWDHWLSLLWTSASREGCPRRSGIVEFQISLNFTDSMFFRDIPLKDKAK